MIPSSLIVAFLAVIFYAVDKYLGIVMAIVLPAVVGADSTGDYSETFVVVLFAVSIYFVKRISEGE